MDTDRSDARTREQDPATDRDASDVVDGPIGGARLVEPTDAESASADLEALPAIDDTESAGAVDGRPAADPA